MVDPLLKFPSRSIRIPGRRKTPPQATSKYLKLAAQVDQQEGHQTVPGEVHETVHSHAAVLVHENQVVRQISRAGVVKGEPGGIGEAYRVTDNWGESRNDDYKEAAAHIRVDDHSVVLQVLFIHFSLVGGLEGEKGIRKEVFNERLELPVTPEKVRALAEHPNFRQADVQVIDVRGVQQVVQDHWEDEEESAKEVDDSRC